MNFALLLMCLVALTLESYSGLANASVLRNEPVAFNVNGNEPSADSDDVAREVNGDQRPTGRREEGDSFFPRGWGFTSGERDSFFPTWSRTWTHRNGDRTSLGTYGRDDDSLAGIRGYHSWNNDRSFLGGFLQHDQRNNGTSAGFRLSHRWKRAAGEQDLIKEEEHRVRRSPQRRYSRFDLNATLDNDRYGRRGTITGRLSTPTWYGSGRYSYGTDGHTVGGEIGRTWRHGNGASTSFRGFGHYNSQRGSSIGIGLSHRWRRSLREQVRAGIMPELEPNQLRRIPAHRSNGNPMPNDYQDARILGTPYYFLPEEYYYGQDSQEQDLIKEGQHRVRRSPQSRFDLDATLDNDRYGRSGTITGRLSTPTWNGMGRYSYGTDGHTVGGEIGRTWRHGNGASTSFRGFGHYNSQRGSSIGIGLSHRWRRSLREQARAGIMPELELNQLRRIPAERSNRNPIPNDYQDGLILGTPYYFLPEKYYYGQDSQVE